MKRLNQKPIDVKDFVCPQCNKQRMTRPINHKVNLEKQEVKTKTGEMVSFYIDLCDNCLRRNYRDFFEPTRSDIRKVLKAMQEENSDLSLEELL